MKATAPLGCKRSSADTRYERILYVRLGSHGRNEECSQGGALLPAMWHPEPSPSIPAFALGLIEASRQEGAIVLSWFSRSRPSCRAAIEKSALAASIPASAPGLIEAGAKQRPTRDRPQASRSWQRPRESELAGCPGRPPGVTGNEHRPSGRQSGSARRPAWLAPGRRQTPDRSVLLR